MIEATNDCPTVDRAYLEPKDLSAAPETGVSTALFTAQSDPKENGPYQAVNGAWVRVSWTGQMQIFARPTAPGWFAPARGGGWWRLPDGGTVTLGEDPITVERM